MKTELPENKVEHKESISYVSLGFWSLVIGTAVAIAWLALSRD